MPSRFSSNAVSQVKLLHIFSESHKAQRELKYLFDGALHCESSLIKAEANIHRIKSQLVGKIFVIVYLLVDKFLG